MVTFTGDSDGTEDTETDSGEHFYRATLFQRGVFAVVVCPTVCLSACLSVRPSVTNRYCIERTGRIELFLARTLPSTYPTLCCKEIWVSPKLGYFPLELCAKLRTWKISPWQVDRVVS